MMQMDNNDFLRRLNSWADECHTDFPNAFGYPANYNINLTEFYRWYLENGLGTKLLTRGHGAAEVLVADSDGGGGEVDPAGGNDTREHGVFQK